MGGRQLMLEESFQQPHGTGEAKAGFGCVMAAMDQGAKLQKEKRCKKLRPMLDSSFALRNLLFHKPDEMRDLKKMKRL